MNLASKGPEAYTSAPVTDYDPRIAPEKSDVFHFDGIEASSFAAMNLRKSLTQLRNAYRWSTPTPFQSKAIPLILTGQSVIGKAPMGAGKTTAMLLAVAEQVLGAKKNARDMSLPYLLYITKTREELMVAEEFFRFLSMEGLSLARFRRVYTGPDAQIDRHFLPEVILATYEDIPELLSSPLLGWASKVVCDNFEALEKLPQNTAQDFLSALMKLERKVQLTCFSSLEHGLIEQFAATCQRNFYYVTQSGATPLLSMQSAYLCEVPQKFKLLLGLLTERKNNSLIVVSSKMVASWLEQKLKGNQLTCQVLPYELSPDKCKSLIADIEKNPGKILIVSDLQVTQGCLPGIADLYFFDLPRNPCAYVNTVHRSLANKSFLHTFSFVCDEFADHVLKIRQMMEDQFPAVSWPAASLLQIPDQAPSTSLELMDAAQRDKRARYDSPRPGRSEASADRRPRPSSDRPSKPAETQRRTPAATAPVAEKPARVRERELDHAPAPQHLPVAPQKTENIFALAWLWICSFFGANKKHAAKKDLTQKPRNISHDRSQTHNRARPAPSSSPGRASHERDHSRDRDRDRSRNRDHQGDRNRHGDRDRPRDSRPHGRGSDRKGPAGSSSHSRPQSRDGRRPHSAKRPSSDH